MSNQKSKHKVGTLLECIKSESIAYIKGETYEVVERDFSGTTTKGLIGKDGLFDPFSLICSSFAPVNATKQAVSNLKVVK